MVQPLFLVAMPEHQAEVESISRDDTLQKVIQELRLPQLAYASPYQFGAYVVERCMGSNKFDSIASFAGPQVPMVVLAKGFFSLPRDTQRFILTHELRHAFQRLIDHGWLQHNQYRLLIVRRFAPITKLTCRFFSAPEELDAQEYAWRFSSPVVASSIVRRTAEEVQETMLVHRNTPAPREAVLLALLPQLYELSHLARAKKFTTADDKKVEDARMEMIQFMFSRIPPGVHTEFRQLFEKYLAAGASTFLTEAATLLQKLRLLPAH